MGLELYVGSFTRYYTGDWETLVEQLAHVGHAVQVVRPPLPADPITHPAVIAGIVHDGMHPARLDAAAIEARNRMTATGASEADVARFGARVAADALGVTVYLLTSEYPRRPGLPGVMLVETDPDGRSTGRSVGALEVELGQVLEDSESS